KRTSAASFLTLFLSVGLRLLEPWPLKFVFDELLDQREGADSGSPAFIRDMEPMTLLTLCAVAILAVVTLRALTQYLTKVFFVMISIRVMARVRTDLFAHLQRLSLSYHRRARSGDTITRVMGDVRLLRDVASTALLPLLATGLVFLGMWSLMFWMQWRLALLALVVLPLFWVLTACLSKRIRQRARKYRRQEGAIAATAAESIQAIEVVQSLSLEPEFDRAFERTTGKSLKEDLKGSRMSTKLQRSVDVLQGLATALVLWYGVRLILVEHAMTAGDLIVFLHYVTRAFKPMKDLAKYTGRLAKAAASGERILEILDHEPAVRDRPDARSAPAISGHLRFDHVCFAYEGGSPVLNDFDLTIAPGERVALVGPSGIGKSTVAGLVLRLHDPTAGNVLVDGHDIRDWTLQSLRQQISMVLQESVLFAVSVRENIRYGCLSATEEQIEAAAELANAHGFISALPEGYDTVVGERGATLSAGQRQRIAIARAAVRQSPILVLDEPTTGLDEQASRHVIDALWRLAEGCTTLLITHDLSLAAQADRVVSLHEGRVDEDGSHAELLAKPGWFASSYRSQRANRPETLPEVTDAISG
ncbi:MAG: ABC transporter ATP-binding protein/permease, partial [Phycisphaerae bacterium]|nr:ABC transporter ATP-binding protein/permease [Phycisphaerae bacterium]